MDTDILLGVKRSKFRRDDPNNKEHESLYMQVKEPVLERDNYTCQFCGYKCTESTQVHHKDDDHSNQTASNLISTCPLCHACHHLGLASILKQGRLIWIDPALGVKQSDIIQLVRYLVIALLIGNKQSQVKGTEAATKVSNFLSATEEIRGGLRASGEAFDKIFGQSDPHYLSHLLLSMDDEDYKNRADILNGIYFLPFFGVNDYFSAYFKKCAKKYAQMSVSDWVDIAEMQFKKWTKNATGDDSVASVFHHMKLSVSNG